MIDFFQRLDKYFKHRNLNDNQITVRCGISNGIIGKARKRGAMSQDNISKILQNFTELDANWLFTGRGEMIKKEEKSTPAAADEKDEYIKELQKDKIALQKEKIIVLEKEIEQLKKAKEPYTGYRNVAEPDQ